MNATKYKPQTVPLPMAMRTPHYDLELWGVGLRVFEPTGEVDRIVAVSSRQIPVPSAREALAVFVCRSLDSPLAGVQ